MSDTSLVYWSEEVFLSFSSRWCWITRFICFFVFLLSCTSLAALCDWSQDWRCKGVYEEVPGCHYWEGKEWPGYPNTPQPHSSQLHWWQYLAVGESTGILQIWSAIAQRSTLGLGPCDCGNWSPGETLTSQCKLY